MKIHAYILVVPLFVTLLSLSCRREDSSFLKDRGNDALQLVWTGTVQSFDTDTKAGDFEFSSQNVLLVRISNGDQSLVGKATYDESASENPWTFLYSGSYLGLSSGIVEAYLFEKEFSLSNSSISLSYKTPVYGTSEGSFTIQDNILQITASLKPMTGRITFAHDVTSGLYTTVNNLSGITYFSKFDIDNFCFVSSSKAFSYGKMSNRDYIYGWFMDEDNPVLMYDTGVYSAVQHCTPDALQIGKSGWLTLPDLNNYQGWLRFNSDRSFYNNRWHYLRFVGLGSYTMGGSDAGPAHVVTISKPFYIMRYETTRAMWKSVYPEEEEWSDQAVTGKSYEQIQAFLPLLSQRIRQDGYGDFTFRLPSEAEWEIAAKGGFWNYRDDYLFSGSNNPNGYAHLYRDDGTYNEVNPFYYTIGSFYSNTLGIDDMSGNVAELCSDWFGEYPSGPVTDPTGPPTGTYHVVRGGSAYDYNALERLMVTHRCSENDYPADQIGFRLVVEATPFMSE